MESERDIIHRILDEPDASEKVLPEVQDPGLREELPGILDAVRMLEQSERREPPMFFTAEVMKRLPRTQPSLLGRVREFLFAGRVLRWNMASALAAAVLVIAVLTFVAIRGQAPSPVMQAAGPEQSVTVHLTFASPQARTVAVAGDFNKWKTDEDAMKRTDGTWSIDLKLKPGVYTYSFVVDGKTWVPDPGATSYRDDGFGSKNAVMRVNI